MEDKPLVVHAPLAAVEWLKTHRSAEFEEAGRGLLEAWLPEQRVDVSKMDAATSELLVLNHIDTLLVEPRFDDQGNRRTLIEDVLAEAEDTLSAEHVRYLEALAETPMRLYQVSRVNPEKALTLVDLLDPDAPTVTALEKRMSKVMLGGEVIAARAVNLATHTVLAAGHWPFGSNQVGSVMGYLEKAMEGASDKARRRASLAMLIAVFWIRDEFVGVPRHVHDATSGDPLMLITDEYEVMDEERLQAALNNQRTLRQTGRIAWMGELPSAGDKRHDVSLYQDSKTGRFCAFYKTEAAAALGRHWFEGIVGRAVEHRNHLAEDPADIEAEARANPEAALEAVKANHRMLPPEQMTAVTQQMYDETYKDWANTAIPMLHGMSPREACATDHGKERVRALIRHMEANELQFAELGARKPASLKFLWDAVGLAR